MANGTRTWTGHFTYSKRRTLHVLPTRTLQVWRSFARPWYKLSFARAAFKPVLRRSCVIPDLSVLWVIFFVLLVAAILNQLLFKPLIRVMAARETAVASARQLAERAAAQAREA